MVTKDNELTVYERRWIDRFKELVNNMPKGIEVIVNNGSIRIFVSGSLDKHIGSKEDLFDIGSNPELKDSELYSFRNPGNLLPYSEGQ